MRTIITVIFTLLCCGSIVAQELEDDVIEKHISLFVNDYTISLGEEGRRAVERLLDSN
jgi:predicted solute-binding protein